MNRPVSVTVFGVLNLVFGGLGIFGAVVGAIALIALRFTPRGARMPEMFPKIHPVADAFTLVGLPLGLIATIVLTASGVGLLKLRPWGRNFSLYYAMYALVVSALSVLIQVVFVLPNAIEQVKAVGGQAANQALFQSIIAIIGAGIGLVYPGLLWFFMTRPHVVAAFGGAPTTPEPSPAWPSERDALADVPRDVSNPYLAPRTESPMAEAAPGAGGDSIVETFIPSKNGPALASYYLGLFSLFPCLGFPLGVAAVYFGLQGLKNVRQNPAVRGGAHAWVGLICGGLFGLMNLALLAMATLGMIAAMSQR